MHEPGRIVSEQLNGHRPLRKRAAASSRATVDRIRVKDDHRIQSHLAFAIDPAAERFLRPNIYLGQWSRGWMETGRREKPKLGKADIRIVREATEPSLRGTWWKQPAAGLGHPPARASKRFKQTFPDPSGSFRKPQI
jgi:hypothetical protein